MSLLGFTINILALLLSLNSMVIASPINSTLPYAQVTSRQTNDNKPCVLSGGTCDYTLPFLFANDRTVSACISNTKDPQMCTAFFIHHEGPAFGVYTTMTMYRSDCSELANQNVNREDLTASGGWPFDSQLPNVLQVRVDDAFDPSKAGNTPNDPPSIYYVWLEYENWPMAPLLEDYWGYAGLGYMKQDGSDDNYSWWRGQFHCDA